MHPIRPKPNQVITYKSPRELEIMREAGRIVAWTLQELKRSAEPGMTTLDLDRIAAQCFRQCGATTAIPKNYNFPGNICVSINDQVVHGIPGPLKIRAGDLVKVDVAARYQGYVADATITFGVGKVSPEAERLMEITYNGMMAGINAARPGNRLTDIGEAIERYVRRHGLSVVRQFVGHGVGREMHEPPQVQHVGPGGRGPVLRPGLCVAIEPQVNLGSPEVRFLDDGWTAVTADGSLSAHFEHTIAVTQNGPLILTLP
jgi:methionyl aminopeptidase